ncbi:MAG TPA: extracellular solute-binding protein [Alphaproteobacteria bacterium]|nr:extracellular solute-binding protein [Alphaproteobacteria bacterium]
MKFSFIVIVFMSILIVGCAQPGEKNIQSDENSEKSLTIFWAEWAPAESMEILLKDFTAETGIKAEIKVVPWSDFQDETFRVLESKSADFDLVIGDSQWLGRGAVGGHYIELTKFVQENKLDESMLPLTVKAYGEYPRGSERYYAIPAEADAMGWAYRQDLFEDPEEKAAFKAKYGYDLAVPETWYQVRDIAEFFHRPEQGFYGIGIPTGVPHDPITMGVQNVLWAWGGSLGDNEYKVEGHLNSPESVEGLEFYKELYQFTPPGFENAYYTEAQNMFVQGKIPMFFTYIGFFPDLERAELNPYANVTNYFIMPAGPEGRVISLGGQGLSLNSYSKNKEEALIFMKWFIREDVQEKWAELGGFSPNKKVLSSEKFLSATKYNKVLADSLPLMRDFWAVPEYPQLLEVSQLYWNRYVTTNNITAQETMDVVTEKWEGIFEYAGYYKE